MYLYNLKDKWEFPVERLSYSQGLLDIILMLPFLYTYTYKYTHTHTHTHTHAWLVGCSSWDREELDTTDFTFTFHFHALEEEKATHSSILAWRIPGTGEPGGLPFMGSHRVGHNWSNSAAAAAAAAAPNKSRACKHLSSFCQWSHFLISNIIVVKWSQNAWVQAWLYHWLPMWL